MVTLTLMDGVLGDDTGVDGVIVDMGGPAVIVALVPWLSPLARALLVLGMGVSALVALRRRSAHAS